MDAIDVREASSSARDGDALVGDDEVGGESDCIRVHRPAEEPAAVLGHGDLVARALGGAGRGVLGRRADPGIGRSGVLQAIRRDLNVEEGNLR